MATVDDCPSGEKRHLAARDYFTNVASSVSSVAIGFAPLLPYALLDQARTEHNIAVVREPTELVDLGVCRDANGTLGGVKHDAAYSRRRASGGRAGSPCHPNDSKCKSGYYRRCDEEGKYDVRGNMK